MDKFYTLHPEKFKTIIEKYLVSDDFLIEPSVGDGRFLKLFKFNKYYDIDPELNFKDDDKFNLLNFLDSTDLNAVYIGNPPFGKNSEMAIKFIQHCCELNARLICFILPITFKLQKYQNIAFNKKYKLKYEEEYDEFVKDGKEINVSCVFQIWKYKEDFNRPIIKEEKFKNKYFVYETNPINNDYLSIRRVGSKCPELTEGVHESRQDHFIIKLNDNIDKNKFINEYNKINFILSPSTKQKHINKNDLNRQVNLIPEEKILKYYFTDKDKQYLKFINDETY